MRREMSAVFDPWQCREASDPTGYVKGWAARPPSPHSLRVNFRRNGEMLAGDIASFGGPQPAHALKVGIVDPFSPGQLACVLLSTGR